MSEMKKLVEGFPEQLLSAIEIGGKAKLKEPDRKIENIIITGLGGSGIGGTIVSEIVFNDCPVPITVNKDYFIPAFTGRHTLVIVCSYSGNTEETVQAMEAAIKKGAMIVCITSGGKVAELAGKNNFDCILIPGGMPPRACLGYSLVQLLTILSHFKMTKLNVAEEVKNAAQLLKNDASSINRTASEIAGFLDGKIPVIYAVEGYNGTAMRFRQQLNENSKMLCWHHILPEMNHNELVGWAGGDERLAVIILRNENDYSRSQARLEISKDVFRKHTRQVMELWSKGKTHAERALYLIHVTDVVSVMLAEKRKIDAMEINIINHLKGELAKI